MKKFVNWVKRKVQEVKRNISTMIVRSYVKMYSTVASCTGEGYIDTGIKILMAVVIGALLLALLYALFNDTIMPTVTQRITDLFDFAG